jgi:hypothetical protein
MLIAVLSPFARILGIRTLVDSTLVTFRPLSRVIGTGTLLAGGYSNIGCLQSCQDYQAGS